MIKKIIGSIGLVVGLAVVMFFLYLYVSQDKESRRPAPDPGKQLQVAVRPTPEIPQKPAPPAPAPPTAEPAPPHTFAPQPSLEPKEGHGLLAGKYRSYGRAKKLMEKIKKQNIPAFVRKEGKYYEVWAGPFSTPKETEQARKTLKKALKISAKKRELEIPVPK
ncbi:MAG: SPOR domain-containing protein [Syntrophobacterales bacterium]|jgi:cell division septation protein DedD